MKEKQNLVIAKDRDNYFVYSRKFTYKKSSGGTAYARWYFNATTDKFSEDEAFELAMNKIKEGGLSNKRGMLLFENNRLKFVPKDKIKIVQNNNEISIQTTDTKEKPMEKKTVNVIADAKSNEAHNLLDKYVDGSLAYSFNVSVTGQLAEIVYDSPTPFTVKDSTGKLWYFTFIRQGSEPIKPYCLADKVVRANLMGKIFMSKSGNVTSIVTRIENADGSWKINGSISSARLLNEFVWVDKDGNETPCGGEI